MLTDEERNSGVPAWCVQALFPPAGRLSGCAGSDEFEGYDLALEAWGDRAAAPESGLTALAYLWRRFGPPAWHSDPDKTLCRYVLATPHPHVFLDLTPRGSPLAYGVGYLATVPFREALREAVCWRPASVGELNRVWCRPAPVLAQWRKLEGPVGELNRAVHAALRELLRPVFVRDVPITVLGRMRDGEMFAHAAEPSRHAGVAVPLAPLDALLMKRNNHG